MTIRSDLLSEVRAYGQGIIVADQVPVKLAPDVIKNTNLKIIHRVVASDDRSALGGAMAMDENQVHVLAILELGDAVVFSEKDDSPLLVHVDKVKAEVSAPDDNEVARHMRVFRRSPDQAALFFPIKRVWRLALPKTTRAMPHEE